MSFSVTAYPHSGRRALLEPMPAVEGQEAESTLDRSAAYHIRLTHNNRQPLTLTLMVNLD